MKMEAVRYGLEKQGPKGQNTQMRAEGPHKKEAKASRPKPTERQPPATPKTKPNSLNEEA